MKTFFRRIHLYLSLAAGLVILIACLTGAILVFEKDLQMALNKDRYYVEQGSNRLPVDQLVKKAKAAYPDGKINGIKIYTDPKRSAELNLSIVPKSKDGNTKTDAVQKQTQPAKGRQPGFTLYVNPYTGAIIEKYSYRETFFYTVFALHRWLLGGEGSVGKYIVGIATIIFLFILITGIILWWPKTRKVFIQRLNIKWDAGWKRLNHDLHIVLGFYSAIFLFIFAFTGLAWSFEWFNKGIYQVTNSPIKPPALPLSIDAAGEKTISFDNALANAQTVYANAQFYNISFPKDSTEVFNISALRQDALHESATDAVYIDQYSGAVLGQLKFEERSLGAQVRSTFKPVHTGSIGGTPTKIIAFITCLFGVSFPVTGVIMWINRTRKKKKTARLPHKQPAAV